MPAKGQVVVDINQPDNPFRPAPAARQRELIDATRNEWNDLMAVMPEDYVARCVRIGKLLIDLKAAVPNGRWAEYCARSKADATAEDKVPFSPRLAQQFMKIAKNHTLANTQNSAHVFPSNYSTLDILAGIEPKRLEKAIDKGLVHPAMDEDEARLAVYLSKPPSQRDPKVKPEVVQARRFKTFKRAFINLDHAHQVEAFEWLRERLYPMGRDAQ